MTPANEQQAHEFVQPMFSLSKCEKIIGNHVCGQPRDAAIHRLASDTEGDPPPQPPDGDITVWPQRHLPTDTQDAAEQRMFEKDVEAFVDKHEEVASEAQVKGREEVSIAQQLLADAPPECPNCQSAANTYAVEKGLYGNKGIGCGKCHIYFEELSEPEKQDAPPERIWICRVAGGRLGKRWLVPNVNVEEDERYISYTRTSTAESLATTDEGPYCARQRQFAHDKPPSAPPKRRRGDGRDSL